MKGESISLNDSDHYTLQLPVGLVLLCDQIRHFMRKEVKPIDDKLPQDAIACTPEDLARLRTIMEEMGLTRLTTREQYSRKRRDYFALIELTHESDPRNNIRTRVHKEGDMWIQNGRKTWLSAGGGKCATCAKIVLVLSPRRKGRHGVELPPDKASLHAPGGVASWPARHAQTEASSKKNSRLGCGKLRDTAVAPMWARVGVGP